jgi:hypothetical protein
VLKLIIATRGSMPSTRADAALWMAMSARSPASGMNRPGDQAVDLAPLEHHRADRDRVGQMLAGHILGPAFVPAQLDQRGDVALGDGTRIDHRDALGQVQAELRGLGGHLAGGAEQQAASDAAFGTRDRGPDGPGLGPLRQDDQRVSGPGQLGQLIAERRRAQPP